MINRQKSINNRRTEAERATRRAETIDGLERNGREEKLLIDKKSRNNRRTEAEWATRTAENNRRTRAKRARREALIDKKSRNKETIDGMKRNG